MRTCSWFFAAFCVVFLVGPVSTTRAQTFRVATFNVEGYLLSSNGNRQAKSAISRAKVCENVLAMQPDVLALQEIGGSEALLDLQASLRSKGLDFPYSEHVPGFDPAIQVAVLSKFPFTARRPHTNETFLLRGRRFRTSRGFGEVEVRVTPEYTFTLFVAHLKSKRVSGESDEADLRLEEAKLLRERIDAVLSANPDANILLAGDLNDTKDSLSVRTLVGRAHKRLIDARPAERNGDSREGSGNRDPRVITWTHYFARQDSYERIDYLLLSPGMAREWVKEDSYVLSVADWGVASDHRPVVVTMRARDG
jgi:endonuclease/exonuclease/phosphatase family metal-dependent hydrolase